MTQFRIIPPIAEYHSGPYRLAAILQDPGTKFGSGSGAVTSGEVGVLNNDPTARLCKEALEAARVPLSAFLLLNAIPWFDAPSSHSVAMLREGAGLNRHQIIQSGVRAVLLLGKSAWRSECYLSLPDHVLTIRMPHPSRLGLLHFHEDGKRLGREASKQRLFDGFRLAAQHIELE